MSKVASDRQGILAVGNLLIDKMKSISDYPKESMLTHIDAMSISCGGGCLNILFDLANMQPDLALSVAGIVGNDQDGNYILQQCSERGIDKQNIKVDPVLGTSFTDVFINRNNGNRTFFHHSGANSALDIEFVGSLESSAKIAHLAYLLVLPELDKPDELFGSLGAKALSLLQAKGLKTSLDLVSDSDTHRFDLWVKPALKYVDYLIINDEEAYALTGTDRRKDDDAIVYQQLAKQLLDMGVNDTVIIHYPTGAAGIRRGGQAISVGAYTVDKAEIVSTLGAGDAFCAGALLGLHDGQPLKYCMQLGCASARFNLFALSATDAAPTYLELCTYIQQMSN